MRLEVDGKVSSVKINVFTVQSYLYSLSFSFPYYFLFSPLEYTKTSTFTCLAYSITWAGNNLFSLSYWGSLMQNLFRSWVEFCCFSFTFCVPIWDPWFYLYYGDSLAYFDVCRINSFKLLYSEKEDGLTPLPISTYAASVFLSDPTGTLNDEMFPTAFAFGNFNFIKSMNCSSLISASYLNKYSLLCK